MKQEFYIPDNKESLMEINEILDFGPQVFYNCIKYVAKEGKKFTVYFLDGDIREVVEYVKIRLLRGWRKGTRKEVK